MKRARAFGSVIAIAIALIAFDSVAALSPNNADDDLKKVMKDDGYTFCSRPSRPLSLRAMSYCAVAEKVDDCEGLVAACKMPEPKKQNWQFPKWLGDLFNGLGALAEIAMWVLFAALLAALLIPVVRAILKARRDKAAVEPLVAPKKITIEEKQKEELMALGDAEIILQRAEGHRERGELDLALFAYLAASLRALDQRGAIRLARHRTNGEYVRGCKEDAARTPLREVVREVDTVQFGGASPTAEGVHRAASSAITLVRMAPLAIVCVLLSLLALGCGSDLGAPRGPKSDPAGDQLASDLLRKQGVKVGRVPTALPNLPLPGPDDAPAPIVVDFDVTPMEDDTREHLERWVRAGGTMVMIGAPRMWPKKLAGTYQHAESTTISVAYDGDPLVGELAHGGGFSWKEDHTVIASTKDGVTYAAVRMHGRGRVLAFADEQLFTNIVLARKGNAAVLVAIFARIGAHELRFARPEDGSAPPTNPLAAFYRAGLGLAVWHALAATGLLFLAVGIRLSRPAPSTPPRRRAFVEHVTATGAFYARTKHAAHALATYARHVDERLRARMPRGSSDIVSFLAARSRTDPAQVAKLVARANEAKSGEKPRGDEMKTLKALSALYAEADV